MAFLRSPDCDCPDAADLNDGGTGGDVGEAIYYFDLRTGGLPVVRDTDLAISVSVFGDAIEFGLEIDGVNVWVSGCITGSGGTTVAVPFLAETVGVVVNVTCAGYIPPPNNYSWAFTLVASEVRC